MNKKGPRPIQDEFTHLKVSANRKWSLRNIKKGLCAYCSEPRVTGTYCAKHREANIQKTLKSRAKLKSGIPPQKMPSYKQGMKDALMLVASHVELFPEITGAEIVAMIEKSIVHLSEPNPATPPV